MTERCMIRTAAFMLCLIIPCLRMYAGEDAAPPSPPTGLSEIQMRLYTSAQSLIGAESLMVNGRRYSYDCSGTVLAIYASAGIDLFPEYITYSGNGVARIYGIMKTADLLYTTNRPGVGDIIFWDDTYDRNGDGLVNDPLTHVGMVVAVGQDGIISYVHFHYARGIIIEYMNLDTPETYRTEAEDRTIIMNSPMRMKKDRAGTDEKWLSGQLYKVFGKGYLFK